MVARVLPDPPVMEMETPASPAPSVVRATILAQHVVLREKLSRALTVASRALKGEPEGVSLSAIVRDVRDRFRAHLAFEERWLVPLLRETDGWGPERVSRLLEEHARQRAELDTLIEGIEAGWDAQRLALATRSLVTDLLIDMADEERGCVSEDLLRDDVVNVDQATD
jgi:iron-sulfur cluster repair protein YtfE (RIC family)